MKEELFLKFRRSGKVEDYLKYREEVSKEFNENDKKNSRDHFKLNRLQGKPQD